MRFSHVLLPLVMTGLVLAAAAPAADWVDIGDPVSEAGHTMNSWGPIEPLNSGGAYGGIDECRAIWSTLDDSRNATITMDFGDGMNVQVAFKHLEGVADDGFEVYIDGILRYTHFETSTTEDWYVSGFDIDVTPGLHEIEFVATGNPWASWATFGQVCFAEIWVGCMVVPESAGTWGGVKVLFR